MQQHRIRLASPEDQAAIKEIVRQAYEPWIALIGARPAPMDADYAALVAAGRVHVLAPAADIDAGDVAGVIVLTPDAEGLLIENVAVRPDLQGQGLGRRLLSFAEEEASALGLPAVKLFTHEKMTTNLNLYERLGYVETGRQKIDGGRRVHMRKDLGAAR